MVPLNTPRTTPCQRSILPCRLHHTQPGFNRKPENLPNGEPGCCNGFVQFRLCGFVQGNGEFFVGVRIHSQILPNRAEIDKCDVDGPAAALAGPVVDSVVMVPVLGPVASEVTSSPAWTTPTSDGAGGAGNGFEGEECGAVVVAVVWP
jgi:hypothetical protein